jgi:NAD+ kinase
VSAREATRTIERAAVFTHARPDEVKEGIGVLRRHAEKAGVELLFDSEGASAHGLDGDRIDDSPLDREGAPDLCLVLGGDGATLRALRACAGTGIPVFAINFGRIGFLATIDRDGLELGIEQAFAGRFDVMPLPGLVLDGGPSERFAINEVSFQRHPEINLAHLSYSLAEEDIARVPCDGLIAATPAGSTGYNLSVGGPILAWGVEGFTVSLIAPHALSARALVAAPEDELRVVNEGRDAIEVVVDGMPTGEFAPGEVAEIRLRAGVVGLAQLPGESFYRRFREKLLQLTS